MNFNEWTTELNNLVRSLGLGVYTRCRKINGDIEVNFMVNNMLYKVIIVKDSDLFLDMIKTWVQTFKKMEDLNAL